MKKENVLELLKFFEDNEIEVIVDGGWGVDALLDKQTRPHDDLDIAIARKNSEKIRKLLKNDGYKDVLRNDTTEWNYVLGNDSGLIVDIHVFEFDDDGNYIAGIEYPFDSLNGKGIIGGYKVKCIAPEWLVKFHSGYELNKNDHHDIKLLCEKFNIPLPDRVK